MTPIRTSTSPVPAMTFCRPCSDRTMTLKGVIWWSSFQQMMSTPSMCIPSRSTTNSSTAESPSSGYGDTHTIICRHGELMAPLSPLGHETLHWIPGLDSSSRTSRRGGPYRAAIPPATADLHLDLPSDVYAAAENASVAITRFDAELGGKTAPGCCPIPTATLPLSPPTEKAISRPSSSGSPTPASARLSTAGSSSPSCARSGRAAPPLAT